MEEREYYVAQAHSIRELEKQVNEKLKEKWDCYGNLVVVGGGYQILYCHAMIIRRSVAARQGEKRNIRQI